jgi:Protein of unknown function (DUF3617)
MCIHKIVSFLIAGLATTFLALPSAFAADKPMRKSGLWEIRVQNTIDGQKMPNLMTVQTCVDQSKDDLTAEPGDMKKGDVRKQCSKMDMKRTGSGMVIDSVCTVGKHTATGRTVITGNFNSEYRMENTTRFTPPMQGMQTTSSVTTGKWLGPCKPGQKHGSMTVSGMPEMGPGGEFKMDPEMMKRMQQMQQKYGR